ncbi:MAG: hypothetical protein F4Y30_07880 [Chloroflexi bacterium]|nr:hypothetical protein [Chloroflexota bacterium]
MSDQNLLNEIERESYYAENYERVLDGLKHISDDQQVMAESIQENRREIKVTRQASETAHIQNLATQELILERLNG